MRRIIDLLRQAFTRPSEPAGPAATPRRRRSRNDELVWRESQPAWLIYPIVAGSALFIVKVHESVAASGSSALPPIVFALTTCALIPLLLGRLVTEVRGDSLRWHYGWLGWPRWRVDLDDIVAMEPARSTWIEGWGIRFTGEGMLYNSFGTHAVRLRLRDGRRLRLGSQQVPRLLQVLGSRIGQA